MCFFHAASRLLLVAGSGTPGPCAIPAPAADSAPAAQDFNKKHIMVSNVLSGLHYRARASLDPVVPYDFISDEPYLLSKRFHLNSINLSKLSWASSSQPAPPVLLPWALRPPAATLARGLGGLSRDPPAAPWAVERVPGTLAVIRRDGSAAAASSSPGSVYAPLIEPVCTAGSFPVLYPLAMSLCAVQRSPGLLQEAEDAAEVSLIPVRPGLFPCTLIPTSARVSCRSEIPVSRLRFFPASFTIAQTVHASRFEPAVLLERGKKSHGVPVWFPCCARSLRLRTYHAFQI